jgi:hypothetical protein
MPLSIRQMHRPDARQDLLLIFASSLMQAE